MAELTYLASPLMTAASTPSPFVVSKSTEFSAGFAAWKAFALSNGASSLSWLASATTGWVSIDLGAEVEIVGYAIGGSGFNDNVNPKDWTFQGSSNGSSWTTLDTQTGYAGFGGTPTIQTFNMASAAYRYYKLDITLNNGSGSFCGTGPILLILPTPSGGGGGGGGGPFTIDGLTSVKAHWSADAITAHSDGDPVSSLPESISSWHLTGSSTTRPLYRPTGINSLPAVEFDGTDDFMVTASTQSLVMKQPWVIYVLSCDASKFYNTLLALATGSGNPTYANAATPLCDLGWLASSGNGYANTTEHNGTTFQYTQTRSIMAPAVKTIVSCGHGSGVRGLRVNGAWATQVNSSSNETYVSINANLFAHFGRCSLSTPFFDGLLAEMVLLDQSIDGDVERVEGALAAKYAISLPSSHQYAGGAPTTLPGGGSGGTIFVPIED